MDESNSPLETQAARSGRRLTGETLNHVYSAGRQLTCDPSLAAGPRERHPVRGAPERVQLSHDEFINPALHRRLGERGASCREDLDAIARAANPQHIIIRELARLEHLEQQRHHAPRPVVARHILQGERVGVRVLRGRSECRALSQPGG